MPYKEYEETRDQVAWNIAADQSKHISDLIKKAMNSLLIGDIGNCYWTLTGIRILIHPYLEKKERNYFKRLERFSNRYCSDWEKWKKSIEEGRPLEDLKESKNKFAKYTKIYFLKIMDLLRELGYIPEKEDKTQLGF